MNLNKKQLAIAISMAFATGVANATINVPADTGSINFDNAITTPGAINTSSGPALQAGLIPLGFSITAASSKYIRFNIIGTAGWGEVVTAADMLGFAAGDVVVSSGGAIGGQFVIFEINASIDYDQAVLVALDGLIITAADKTDNQISYNLYDTAVDAVAESNSLASQSAKYFGWDTAYEVSCRPNPLAGKLNAGNPEQFVPTSTSGASNTDLFYLTMQTNPNVYSAVPILVANDDYFGAGTNVLMNADHTGQWDPDLNSHGPFPNPHFHYQMVIAGDNMSSTWTGNPVGFKDAPMELQTQFDPLVPMVPGDYSVIVDPAGVTDLAAIDLGVCGTLAYSGSSDRMDFGLTPNGNFQMWIRITNPSETTGPVNVTVWSDDGNSVTFPMGNIAGVASTDLVAEGSTDILDINDVYAAAQAADGTFNHNGGKLRVEVRGAFGEDAPIFSNSSYGTNLAARADNGIHIVGLTISKDGGAFFVTKP